MFEKRLIPFGYPDVPIAVVFFEPQTGIYRREDWDSNFYHYRLRNSHSPTHQFTSDWLDDNIAKARVTDNGLEYSDEFMEALGEAESKANSDFAMFPELEVPSKLSRR